MNPIPTPSGDKKPRDEAYWAQPVSILRVGRTPTGVLNLNVDGRQPMSPLQGFGQLWQKTFRVRLSGASVTSADVITAWKERFVAFWPKWDHFYPPLTGLAPGEVALINMLIPGDIPHGLPLSTGVLVLYADEESFTFMNPQGHMFAGWITFSASEEEGSTVAQIQMLIRPNDLIYELGFRLGGSRSENRFWQLTLASLAAHFGVGEPVQTHVVCIDPSVQWSQFWNIWQNAAIRTVLYRMLTPLRWLLTSSSGGAWATGTRELAEPVVSAAQASGRNTVGVSRQKAPPRLRSHSLRRSAHERKPPMSTITTPSHPATSSPLKRLIIRHPLIAFFVIAFAGEWIAFLPLVLAQNGLGLLPYTVPALGPISPAYWFTVLASIAGPTLASLTVTAITTGTAGVRQLLQRYALWQVGLRWYLLVLVGVPLIQLAFSSVFLGIAPLTAFVLQWPLFFTTFLPNVLIIGVAVQLWEEGGWSGFAVPKLQQRFGAWRMTLIFGPLWAVFHLPAFFVPGQIFQSKVGVGTMVVQMALLIILATLTRMVMTWVFNSTKGSILIAVLLHAALDASNGASAYITHLLSASQNSGYGLGSALLFPLVVTVVLLVFTRGRLGYTPDRNAQLREKPQPAEMPQATI